MKKLYLFFIGLSFCASAFAKNFVSARNVQQVSAEELVFKLVTPFFITPAHRLDLIDSNKFTASDVCEGAGFKKTVSAEIDEACLELSYEDGIAVCTNNFSVFASVNCSAPTWEGVELIKKIQESSENINQAEARKVTETLKRAEMENRKRFAEEQRIQDQMIREMMIKDGSIDDLVCPQE